MTSFFFKKNSVFNTLVRTICAHHYRYSKKRDFSEILYYEALVKNTRLIFKSFLGDANYRKASDDPSTSFFKHKVAYFSLIFGNVVANFTGCFRSNEIKLLSVTSRFSGVPLNEGDYSDLKKVVLDCSSEESPILTVRNRKYQAMVRENSIAEFLLETLGDIELSPIVSFPFFGKNYIALVPHFVSEFDSNQYIAVYNEEKTLYFHYSPKTNILSCDKIFYPNEKLSEEKKFQFHSVFEEMAAFTNALVSISYGIENFLIQTDEDYSD